MRRSLTVGIATIVVMTLAAPPASAVTIRDVGKAAGLPRLRHSWSVQVHDINHDGWPDLSISHHGQRVTIYRNRHRSGVSLGYTPVVTLTDTIHHWNDPHACDWADVNGDGLDDLYCTTGADQGTSKKWNQLWIQRPAWTFTNHAHRWGVEDVWGRGRYPSFIDLNHDKWPDLFVGNDAPRLDDHLSPNRTFVNVRGDHFREVHLGVTQEQGALCAHTVDVNHDGWDDLLVCGNAGLKMYVRRPLDGFVDRRAALGMTAQVVRAAELVDVSGDNRPDLVAVTQTSLLVQLRRSDGTFAPPSTTWPLSRGHGLAVGDVDHLHGPDIYVVQACDANGNVPDVLLLNAGTGKSWTRVRGLPRATGCGDVAASLDFDRDGRQDFVVLNGAFVRDATTDQGPDQLLTAGRWGT